MFAVLLCVPLATPPRVDWQSPQFYKHRAFMVLIETNDQPTAAQFLSFSGSRDLVNVPASLPDRFRAFANTGGSVMRGITAPRTMTLEEPLPDMGQTWSLLGTGPIVLRGE
jgi:hypothetical protein